MGDMTDSGTVNSRPLPIREDCWSEEATATLVEAWGNRYVELSRGNLRQKDWADVAEAVNAVHGLTKKTHRTDVQCKNRIDTIKKKYKVEKTRVTASNGAFVSSWRFFDRLDFLIGSNFPATAAKKEKQPSSRSLSPSPPVALPLTNSSSAYRRNPNPSSNSVVAVGQKRPAAEDIYLRRTFMAAAAAADSESDEEEDEPQQHQQQRQDRANNNDNNNNDKDEEMRRLARAIEKFGEVYERVERDKLRQMVDLEKQRMKFAKDVEMERMRVFTETQIQLEKIKKGKRSAGPTNGERDY
ncbi:unnamed protein product [Linum tenue]|uniref:Myb/SANT-like DNA-binding domain-containing protein n=1 Tax=Linum tenue TaxID=586396 RepID=A0AAV0RN89_9ROSI|nr:unnamed protein product [Linum tenue]